MWSGNLGNWWCRRPCRTAHGGMPAIAARLVAAAIIIAAAVMVSGCSVVVAADLGSIVAGPATCCARMRERHHGKHKQRAERSMGRIPCARMEDHPEIMGMSRVVGQACPREALSAFVRCPFDSSSENRRPHRSRTFLATTLATRTVSMYVRSCPLLSGQTGSPRRTQIRRGLRTRAVRSGLREALIPVESCV